MAMTFDHNITFENSANSTGINPTSDTTNTPSNSRTLRKFKEHIKQPNVTNQNLSTTMKTLKIRQQLSANYESSGYPKTKEVAVERNSCGTVEVFNPLKKGEHAFPKDPNDALPKLRDALGLYSNSLHNAQDQLKTLVKGWVTFSQDVENIIKALLLFNGEIKTHPQKKLWHKKFFEELARLSSYSTFIPFLVKFSEGLTGTETTKLADAIFKRHIENNNSEYLIRCIVDFAQIEVLLDDPKMLFRNFSFSAHLTALYLQHSLKQNLKCIVEKQMKQLGDEVKVLSHSLNSDLIQQYGGSSQHIDTRNNHQNFGLLANAFLQDIYEISLSKECRELLLKIKTVICENFSNQSNICQTAEIAISKNLLFLRAVIPFFTQHPKFKNDLEKLLQRIKSGIMTDLTNLLVAIADEKQLENSLLTAFNEDIIKSFIPVHRSFLKKNQLMAEHDIDC
jgi:hypothetical protein